MFDSELEARYYELADINNALLKLRRNSDIPTNELLALVKAIDGKLREMLKQDAELKNIAERV